MLEGDAEVLVLEGNADVVDAALESEGGQPDRTVQAKTRVEPYVWGPQEIAETIRAWLKTAPPTAERFDFVTDGSFGPGVVNRLAPALGRAGSGDSTKEDREYLSSLGLDSREPALGRVQLSSRMPDGRTLLERETVRVLELRERVEPLNVEQARDVVWRLFGETVLGSGEAAPCSRRLSRDRIGEIVGIPPDVIDAADPWSASLEQTYREALAEIEPDVAWVLLDLQAAERPFVLSFVSSGKDDESSRTEPATVLLDRDESVLLQGRAGAGKTTTLSQLRTEALNRGLLPLHVRFGSYLAGTLEQLLRRSIERAAARRLAPRTLATLLERPDTIVFLDGVGELVPEQRQALIADLGTLRVSHPRARVILAARDAGPLAALGATGYVLQGLDHEGRRQIAAALTANGDELAEQVEEALSDVVDNPLLFTMAAGLNVRGVEVDSRAALFEGFVNGLQSREEGVPLSPAARAGVECACFQLRLENRFSADQWWWLERLVATTKELVERGVLEAEGASGEELLRELRSLGLVQPVGDGFELGLLHDLFCDWLASQALRHGLRELPDPLGEALEEAAVFLAEHGRLSSEQLLAIAGNAVAASRVVDAAPASDVDPELADALWQRLRSQLDPDLRGDLNGRLHLSDGTGSVIGLAAAGPRQPVDAALLAASSPVISMAGASPSSLSVAVDLWLAVLRLRIREGDVERPLPEPRDDADLVDLIQAAAERRSENVTATVGNLAPALLPRVKGHVEPLGMRAWVLPSESFPGIPGTNTTIDEHLMYYTSADEGVHVELVSAPGDIPEDVATQRTSAEHYLRDSSSDAVRQSVDGALSKLMPRFRA